MIFLYSIAEIRIFVTNTTNIIDMKHNLLLFSMLFLVMPLIMKATPVDEGTAREVGFRFMNANAKEPMRGINDLQLVTTYSISRGDAAFYIFNMPNGFVIVAAVDCVTPILGYSNEGQFDEETIPIQMQDYLQSFVEQIQYGIENHLEADEQTARQWEMVRTTGQLLDNRTSRTVEPLLTAQWSQNCYYNAMCPEDENGRCGHCVTGCVATAMAQIMHYWGYPEHGTGSHSYTPSGYPEQYVDFGATNYDWDNMPNSLNASSSSEQINAVATLMWHCGVSVNMRYGPGASAAYTNYVSGALFNYFNYSNELYFTKMAFYPNALWKAMLKDCLNLGRPLYYDASSELNIGGHAFVCDGYDNNDMFHFNWGWSGSSNGFFFIGHLTGEYNNDNGAIFNIHPQGETTNCTIEVSTNNADGGTASGGGTFAYGTNVTLTATANNGYGFCYWEENGGIASTNPNYSFYATYNRNLVAVFAEPFTVTVSASEGGTATGGGSYYYGESCSVSATPDEGNSFGNWTANGLPVFSNPNYTFNVTGNTIMTAHFVLEGNIVFADDNVKAICVDNWDINGDGELSYAEAASVTDLGQVFRNNTEITSFEELQYFIGLTKISNYAFNNCSGLTGGLFIPNSVTSIGLYAFCNCSGLTGGLFIPNSVTSIGRYAFCNCRGLIGSLTIPNSVLYIGENAFINCSGFTDSLTISNSVTWIDDQAFCNCSGLTGSLVIPNSVVHIGNNAFKNCTGLTGTLTIPNSVNFIDWGAFSGCSNLSGPLIIPNSITTINSYTFENCIGLTGSLTIPNSVTTIGYGAFRNCSGFNGSLTIPNSVTSIDGSAFYNCSGLISLNISNSVTSIGSYAFYNCRGLTGSLTIPNSVTSIGTYAFYNCSGIKSCLTIGSSVTSIGNYAFFNCRDLTSIIVLAETPPTIELNSFYFWISSSIYTNDTPLYVPCESVDTYQIANIWKYFSNIMGMCASGTVTVAADPVEGGVVTGTGVYECGTSCTVTATPNENYTFMYWTENNNVVSTQAEYTFVVPTTCNLVAHFTLPLNVIVSVNPTEGGMVNGGGVFDYGNTCTVTATPNENYTFMYWTENGDIVSSDAEYSFMVTDNRDLVARFTLPLNITVSAYPTEGGTVSGDGVFDYGSNCTVTATPNENFSFMYWTENDTIVSTVAEYSFIVTDNRNIVAHFTLPLSITASADPAEYGTVSGGGLFDYGSDCTLTATANEGYIFTKWTNNGNVVSYSFNYTFSVTENTDLVAHFQSVPNGIIIGEYSASHSSLPCRSYNKYSLSQQIYTANEMGTACEISSVSFFNTGARKTRNFNIFMTHTDKVTFDSSTDWIPVTEADLVFSGNVTMSTDNWTTIYFDTLFVYDGISNLVLVVDNNSGTYGYSPDMKCQVFNVTGYQAIGINGNNINYDPYNPSTYSGSRWQQKNRIIFGVPSYDYTVNVTAEPSEGGTVAGGGLCYYGQPITITATANEGYVFRYWTKDGSVVSYLQSYSFSVTENATFVAHFAAVNVGNIVFADENVKAICVANWDTDGDGELSYAEAASVTSLGEVFRGNTEITSFDEFQFFIGLSSISENAFNSCSGLTRLPIFPNSVTSIGKYAFLNCRGIIGELTIPNSIISIGYGAFTGCTGITGNLIIPNSVISIGEAAFHSCSGLTGSLVISNSVVSIGDYAFCNCYNIKGDLLIPSSVTTIGKSAFSFCYSLSGTLTIPDAVTSIGERAFYGCRDLSSIIVLTELPPILGTDAFYQIPITIPVYVPCGSVEVYQSSGGWNAFSNIMCITSGTISVVADPDEGGEVSGSGLYEGGTFCTVTASPNEGYCFANWTENGNVLSYDSIYSFVVTGERVLTAHFASEENIVFADANVKAICVANWDTNGDGELSYAEAAVITSLGEVFRGNTEITSFEELQYFISLSTISNNAFKDCSSLTGSLIIPNTVTSIGSYAFYNCSGLTGALIIPNAVTSIGSYAFYNCTGLTGSLIIPNNVTIIGTYAFCNCNRFTTLSIGNSVTSIGFGAFCYCNVTGKLFIPNSVISIGDYAFFHCNGLTGELLIPNSVTSIGNYAFFGCDLFTSLTILNSVTSIGNSSFDGCSRLTSMVVQAHYPPTLGSDVFNSVDISIPVYVPCESVGAYHSSAGWDAFTNFIGMCSSGTIAVATDPLEGGAVSGAGTYEGGTLCTVIAMPSEGYDFANWTENDNVVSYDSNYSFVVTGDRVLTAHFVTDGNIDFADANVKAICVANWDTNGDGELSYAEAASVSSLGQVFYNETEITSFDELQFFIGLNSICYYAFYGCSGLSRLPIFPRSVKSIDYMAFAECTGLSGELIIPNTVTSIGKMAFFNCTGLLSSLIIGNSVTTIGEDAFYGCSNLSGTLIIGSSVSSIGGAAFYYCGGITSMVVFAETPPLVGSSAFYHIPSNIPMYVPCESVETYQSADGWNAFSNIMCISSGTISVVAEPLEGGEVSGAGMYEGGTFCTVTATTNVGYFFANWTKNGHIVSNSPSYSFVVTGESVLTAHFVTEGNIVFADANVKAICVANWDTNGDGELSYVEAASVMSLDEVFYDHTEITSFEELQYFIGLTTISNHAFFNCSGLTGNLLIPNSVTSIGESAFWGCTGLTGDLVIPNSVTTIGNWAFLDCSGFTGSLIIGNSVTTIGYMAFSNCSGFRGGLTIGNSMNLIVDHAFSNCSGFTGDLTIPNSVTSIGNSAFCGCSGFTGNLTIPNSVTSIGFDAFYGCSGLTGNLVIPNTVTEIGGYTFYGCSGFTGNLTIPNSVTIIGDGAFQGCSGFTGNLTIGNSVTSIGSSAFNNCSGLTGDLVIPNSVTTIGDSAFSGCSGFTGNLTFGNSVTSISSSAFNNCSGLTGDLVIPNSVTTIGNRAFYGCSGLTGDLTIPSSVTSIGSYAFNNCRTLSSVIMLSSTVPSLGNGAFSGSNANYYIYVPYPSLDAYKTAAIWSNYEPRILPMAYATVPGYGVGNDKWVFIASPLSEDVIPTTIDNMLLGTNYDLYQFDQSATEEEWQNYKVDSFNLVNGQGYVYAKEAEVNIIFKGAFNEDETKVVSLDYDAEKANPGWNLVGNPFPVEAYIDRPYYVMNEDGTAINPIAVPASTPIPPCVGVLVKADGTGESVTFSRSVPGTNK